MNLGPMGLNQVQNKVFYYFLEFGSKVYLKIEYDDGLGPNLAKRANIRPEIRFLVSFLPN